MAKACDRCIYKSDTPNMCEWGETHKITYKVTDNPTTCTLFIAKTMYERWPAEYKENQKQYVEQNREKVLDRIKQIQK